MNQRRQMAEILAGGSGGGAPPMPRPGRMDEPPEGAEPMMGPGAMAGDDMMGDMGMDAQMPMGGGPMSPDQAVEIFQQLGIPEEQLPLVVEAAVALIMSAGGGGGMGDPMAGGGPPMPGGGGY